MTGTDPTPAGDGHRREAGLALTLGWVLGLGVALVTLHALGRSDLSAPPLGSLAGVKEWLDGRDTATAAFALLRVVALIIAWYLLVVTVLGLAARLLRSRRLVRLANASTLPAVRRLLGSMAGVGLYASTATLAAAPLHAQHGQRPAASSTALNENDDAPAERSRARAVLRRLPDRTTVVMERIPHPPGDGTATMRVLDERPDPPTPPAPTPRTTWTIQPGDHLWHVARAVLAETWQRAPADAEVLPYWRILIEHNRGRLVDPANPDLVYAGQIFELPRPPPLR